MQISLKAFPQAHNLFIIAGIFILLSGFATPTTASPVFPLKYGMCPRTCGWHSEKPPSENDFLLYDFIRPLAEYQGDVCTSTLTTTKFYNFRPDECCDEPVCTTLAIELCTCPPPWGPKVRKACPRMCNLCSVTTTTTTTTTGCFECKDNPSCYNCDCSQEKCFHPLIGRRLQLECPVMCGICNVCTTTTTTTIGCMDDPICAKCDCGPEKCHHPLIGPDLRKNCPVTCGTCDWEETTTTTTCSTCDERMDANGWDYRGCQSSTRNGHTCQKWSSQSPHTHEFVPEGFGSAGIACDTEETKDEATMKASGWEWQRFTGKNNMAGKVGVNCLSTSWHGYANGNAAATLSKILTGEEGSATLTFGNCMDYSLSPTGRTNVYLDGKKIASASGGNISETVTFYFADGALLELKDEEGDAIISITSLQICSSQCVDISGNWESSEWSSTIIDTHTATQNGCSGEFDWGTFTVQGTSIKAINNGPGGGGAIVTGTVKENIVDGTVNKRIEWIEANGDSLAAYYKNTAIGDHNYCRQPDGDKLSDKSSIWCYTTDSSKRWDFCLPIGQCSTTTTTTTTIRKMMVACEDDEVCPTLVGLCECDAIGHLVRFKCPRMCDLCVSDCKSPCIPDNWAKKTFFINPATGKPPLYSLVPAGGSLVLKPLTHPCLTGSVSLHCPQKSEGGGLSINHQLEVRCQVCSGTAADIDPREGQLGIKFSWGPNVADGIIDEVSFGILGYSVFAVNDCGERTGPALATVSAANIPRKGQPCCDIERYRAYVKWELAYGATSQAFMVAPLTSVGALDIGWTVVVLDDTFPEPRCETTTTTTTTVSKTHLFYDILEHTTTIPPTSTTTTTTTTTTPYSANVRLAVKYVPADHANSFKAMTAFFVMAVNYACVLQF